MFSSIAALNWDTSQLFNSNLELFAVITGFFGVFLLTVSFSKKIFGITFDHVWNWPIGIASSAAYIFIFYDYKLFLNSGLQIFYVVTGFLGWYWWIRGGEDQSRLPITRATPKMWAVTAATAVIGTLVMWQVEANVVKSQAPFWDALIVALSLIAQFVMTRKVLEHWYLWIAVDIVAVILFWNSGLQLTAMLYFVFGLTCVRGLFTWNKMYRRQDPAIVHLDDIIPVRLSEQPGV